MAAPDEDLREIAARRVKEKRDFLGHAGTYVVVNLGLAAIWALTGAGYPWFLWPVLGWGVGLALHGLNVWFGLNATSAAGRERQARAVDREMERLRRERMNPRSSSPA